MRRQAVIGCQDGDIYAHSCADRSERVALEHGVQRFVTSDLRRDCGLAGAGRSYPAAKIENDERDSGDDRAAAAGSRFGDEHGRNLSTGLVQETPGSGVQSF